MTALALAMLMGQLGPITTYGVGTLGTEYADAGVFGSLTVLGSTSVTGSSATLGVSVADAGVFSVLEVGFIAGIYGSLVPTITFQGNGQFNVNTTTVGGHAGAGFIEMVFDGGRMENNAPVMLINLPGAGTSSSYPDAGWTVHCSPAIGLPGMTLSQFTSFPENTLVPFCSAVDAGAFAVFLTAPAIAGYSAASIVSWDGGTGTYTIQYLTEGW